MSKITLFEHKPSIKSFKQNKKYLVELCLKLNEKQFGYPEPFLHSISLTSFEKEWSYEKLLLEATYEFEEDIAFLSKIADMLISKFTGNYDQIIEQYNSSRNVVLKTISTDHLPSPLAKNANRIDRPIPIMFVLDDEEGSQYNGDEIKIQLIPKDYLENFMMPYNSFLMLDKKTQTELINEWEIDVRLSIGHELAHWLNNVTENTAVEKYISKLEKQYDNKREQEHALLFSKIEIQGRVHEIKQLKKAMGGIKWDKLSLIDLIDKTSLSSNYLQHKNDLDDKNKRVERLKRFIEWKKNLFKRLNNEKLLGKQMINDLRGYK